MSANALLEENSEPTKQEISKAIAGNICRCTGYQQIIQTIEEVVGQASTEEG